jgi:choice-of-anchor C domain-containing protein
MKKTIYLCVAVLMALFLLTGKASANLIKNGSFEEGDKTGFNYSYKRVNAGNTSITNWTVGGAGVDWHNKAELNQPQDSNLLVDLNLNSGSQTGTISQNFATVINANYTLKFWLAGPNYESIINVNIAGLNQQFSQASSSNSSLVWGEKILNFTANDTTTTLTFSNPNGNGSYWGPLLDNVSIEGAAPVPLPPALFLFGSGLLGLAGLKRKLSK